MIYRLASFNPNSILLYKWGYSLSELKEAYFWKQKEYAVKKKMDYKFLVELASKALGGSSSGEVGKLTEEDLEDLSDEQLATMQEMLGEDFDKNFGYTDQ